MTLFHNSVGTPYLIADIGDDSRPQLISRHSSSLPVGNKVETKQKVLSRRSRSASPCIKKMNSICSETNQMSVRNAAKGLPQPKRKLAELIVGSPLPVIIKQASQTSGKNLKSSRSSAAASKQRSQMLNDHKNSLKSPCVWEQICGVQSDTQFLDVNSNLGYNDSGRSAKHVYSPRQISNDDLKCKSSRIIAKQEDPASSCPIFDFVPLEVVLHIFSYVNQVERGRCMFVSKRWYYLTRTPHLWRTVNLREFVLCYGHDMPEPCDKATISYEEELVKPSQCTKVCYGRYMRRIDSYIMFLIDIQVQVRLIAISFDLASDSWLSRIKRLFRHVNFRQLVYADFDWHVTPVKPMRFQDVAYATRRRERHFLDFLQEFVTEMPSLKSLVVPFGWTTSAMRYLTLLPKLNNLVLKQYSVYCTPGQDVFDKLANMKGLEKLLIEVWMARNNPHRYNISSATLRYLDLSQCRSFYLQSVDLPSLEVLKIGRNIEVAETQDSLPCLYDVITTGAPKLTNVNNVVMTLMNRSAVEYVFSCVCPCKKHHHRRRAPC